MNGSDFRRWRTGYGLSQQDLADKMGVTRNTIQNWEAQSGDLSTIAANGVKIWDRRLRQEEPLRMVLYELSARASELFRMSERSGNSFGDFFGNLVV